MRTTYEVASTDNYHDRAWIDLDFILHQHGKDSHTYMTKSLTQLKDSTKLRVGAFYCLPKVHKIHTNEQQITPQKIPGRPIVSAINTIAYHTSIYLKNFLQRYIHIIPTICESSRRAANQLKSHRFPKTSTLLSADVKSLYPSIANCRGLDALNTFIIKTNESHRYLQISNKQRSLVINLMKWVLENNFIKFKGITFRQIQGVAMGQPTAPTYANIFLYIIEQSLIKSSLCYFRYLEDIFFYLVNRARR